jgi:tetratricopeptide (TPR) repeat protein
MSYLGGDLLSLQTGLRDARRALEQLPDHAGVLHSVADFIVEVEALAPDQRGEKTLREAVDLVERAIAQYPKRARFYYTRGRLRRLLSDYPGALDDLGRAIQLERGFDSQLRIAVYHAERNLVQSDRTFDEFLANSRQAQADLEAKHAAGLDSRVSDLRSEMTVKMTETVAFVTGFISLVLTTSGLAAGRPLPDAVGLIGAEALILFSLAFVGAWLLRRELRRNK